MRIFRAVLTTSLVASLGLVVPAATPAASAYPSVATAKKFAVVIGLNKHKNGRPRTNVGGMGDAKVMRDLLVSKGWPAANVKLLTEGAATGAGIRKALKWLSQVSDDQSMSVVHYSGHVKQLNLGGKDGDSEKTDENLWPYDSKFVADGDLSRSIKATKGFVWVNIAGCEAAGFDDGISGPNRLFTASSRETEKSYEFPKWKMSVWAGLLVRDALRNGSGDLNHDGRVSLHEAFAYASYRAPRMTASQKKGAQNPVLKGGSAEQWFLDTPYPPPAQASEQKPGCSLGDCGDGEPAVAPSTNTNANMVRGPRVDEIRVPQVNISPAKGLSDYRS